MVRITDKNYKEYILRYYDSVAPQYGVKHGADMPRGRYGFGQLYRSALAHIFAPGMAKRGYGRIVNVASMTALLPGLPRLALYGAAKKFMISFSESIATELAHNGVHVTALCPGLTRTNIFANSGLEKKAKNLPEFLWMDADTVARQGYDAVENGAAIHVTGRVNRAIALTAKYMPEWLVRKYLRKRSNKIRRKQRNRLNHEK